MYITLTPMRSDKALILEKSEDILTINGEAFDFTALPDGATLPREAVTCDFLAADVERINGVLHLTLILPHGRDAPQETLFPVPITVASDGPVILPPYEVDNENE